MVNMLKNGNNMSVLPDPAIETRNKVKKRAITLEKHRPGRKEDCKPKQVKK